MPPEACPDSVLPVVQGNKLPSIKPVGAMTLNICSRKLPNRHKGRVGEQGSGYHEF